MTGERWYAEYRARLAELGRRTGGAEHRLAEIEATVTSPDGAVTVTVDAGGGLAKLAFGEHSTRLDREELAEAVLAGVRQARVAAGQQALAAVALAVGPNPEATAMLRRHLGGDI
jgi:hypothetical protein